MFGMKIRRHRNFESSFLMFQPECRHAEQGRAWTITGHGGGKPSKHSMKPLLTEFPTYMECPWMTGKEAAQAIPPSYTKFIGEQLLQQIEVAA